MTTPHDAPEGVVLFRQERLAPGALLAELVAAPARKMYLRLPAGLGKSYALAGLVAHAPVYDAFERVVLLVDQNRTLNEYIPRLQRELPPAILGAAVFLAPRPRGRCGDLDEHWCRLESSGCSALARTTLCPDCPHHDACPWLDQADGRRLLHARLVVGVQAYARLYGELLAPLPGGRRTLLLLDEVAAVSEPKTRFITGRDLRVAMTVCRQMAASVDGDDARRLALAERALRHLASRGDLLHLPRTPALGRDLSVALQHAGEKHFHGAFRHVMPDVQQLGRRSATWYHGDGGVAWHEPLPIHPHTMLAATTGAPVVLVREKLGTPDLEVLADLPVQLHPGTRIFNLRTGQGSRRHFHRHAMQLMDFFAGVVAIELAHGHRVLLLACKEHIDLCRTGMEERIRTRAGREVRIATPEGNITCLDPSVEVALVNFGVTGSNIFESFDTCMALDSYFVPEAAVEEGLADLLVGNAHPKVTIEEDGDGVRRVTCHTDNPTLQEVAQALFLHMEAGVVLQAIGRVRPNTRPRLVIIQQKTDLGLGNQQVFTTLEQARAFFHVPTTRALHKNAVRDGVVLRRMAGMKQAVVAREMDIGLRTVKRYWRCHET